MQTCECIKQIEYEFIKAEFVFITQMYIDIYYVSDTLLGTAKSNISISLP